MFTLTDDQVKQITAILVSAEKQAIPVRRDQSLDPKDRGTKLLEIEKQKAEAIDKVLTPDQLQKADAARMKRALDQQVQGALKEYAQAGVLTDAQKQQITAIVADREKQMQAIRADQTLSTRDRGAKLGGVYAAARVQMENVLTPDQQATLLKERSNRQAQYQAENWVHRFGTALQLTDQQTTDIKAVIMDEAQKVSAIMSDKTVKPAQRALQVDSDAKLLGILTPDQQQKLAQAMKPPVGAGH
jgi:Spy/CpxP family protein refolding chaperone